MVWIIASSFGNGKKKKKLLGMRKIEEYMDAKDEIGVLQNKIKTLRLMKKKYLIDNSKYVFNHSEEKNDISEGGGGL